MVLRELIRVEGMRRHSPFLARREAIGAQDPMLSELPQSENPSLVSLCERESISCWGNYRALDVASSVFVLKGSRRRMSREDTRDLRTASFGFWGGF